VNGGAKRESLTSAPPVQIGAEFFFSILTHFHFFFWFACFLSDVGQSQCLERAVLGVALSPEFFFFPTSDIGGGSVASCSCICLGVRWRWFCFLLPATMVVLRVFCFGGRRRWFCFRQQWWLWLLPACSVLVSTGSGSISGDGGGYVLYVFCFGVSQRWFLFWQWWWFWC
jgi:hypothetical protein